MAPKLDVSDVGMVFGRAPGTVEALRSVSLNVSTNEMVSIVGGSGCGKSTLLRIIGGLTAPTSGHVTVDSRRVAGPGVDRGMVFQAYSLYPWLSVYENVAFGLRLRGATRAAIRERVQYYLEIVGLSDRGAAMPSELSGGMKQRIAIARALANEPALILLDEPFGALDAQTRSRMQEFLHEVRAHTSVTMLLITHDIEEAVFLSERIYLMQGPPGQVVAEIAIDLGRERSAEVKYGARFNELRRNIHERLAKSVRGPVSP